MGHQPSTVVLVITIFCVCSVFQRSVTFVNALQDIVRKQDSAHGAPEIDTVEEEIILSKGASCNITCKFDQPIIWKPYASSYDWVPRVDYKDFKTDDPDKPYGSLLMLMNASAQHVGRYYCIDAALYNKDLEDELDHIVAEYLATTVYVYVNDPDHPLVPVDKQMYIVDQYEDFTIPCKPTHPDIEVELVKDRDGALVETLEYSTTQGFELSFNSNGSFYCQVKDKPDHRIHFSVSIKENSLSEYLPIPSIQSDTKDHVPLGQRIRLVCQVNIRARVNLYMTWKAPPNLRVVSKKDKRIKIGPLQRIPSKDAEHREKASQELIVERATMADDGTYRCEVRDINNHRNYHSFTLHVRVPSEDYVMLREENNLDDINVWRNVHGITPPIDIVVEYRSFPAMIIYNWLNGTGSEITERLHGKYELSHNDTHVKLRINDPTVYDTGNYMLLVKAGKAEKALRVRVNVVAKPILQMESKFVKPNEEVSFTCRSISYPRADISFAFVPCLNESLTDCYMRNSARRKWDTPNGTGETLITTVRNYNITSTHHGVVYCKATNKEGSTLTQADLIITDLPETITLVKESPKHTITVGDQVTIVCSALVSNYTKYIKIVRNDKELQPSDGISLDYSPELYAWQARLDIGYATKKHKGLIFCYAKTMKNVIESRALYLEIMDPVAPTIVSGSSNETLFVDLHDPLKLECDVVGTPEPKIFWFKDGKAVHPNKNKNGMQLTKTALIFENLNKDDQGMFQCRAGNKMGMIKKYWKVFVRTPIHPVDPTHMGKSTTCIILGLLVALIFGIVLVSMFYCKKKKQVKASKTAGIVRFEEDDLDHCNLGLLVEEQADLLPYKADYEFPKERLKLGKKLGTGAFGVVMKATATRIMVNENETTVAVKMVKKATDNEVMRALVSELKIMVHLGQHLNVVNLLGAVTKNIAKRELMVIVEYCRFGNVQNFLLKHRPYFIDQINQKTGDIDSSNDENQLLRLKHCYRCKSQTTDYKEPERSVNTTDLVCWASQIACGMEYLASRNVLHGDLAARNILLCDDNVVKICDFGLARSLYKRHNYKKKGEAPLPFKWLALECISDHVFSTYSDVWAYGIVLWELFSLGKVPYPGMEANQELYSKLCDGYRMDKPEYANQDIYDIMVNCWYVKPDSRPSFKDLKNRFNAMMLADLQDYYLELNEPYRRMNAERTERFDTDYLTNLFPPEEPAPAAPYYVNGIILPLPPISEMQNASDYLKMSCAKSKSEERISKYNSGVYEGKVTSVWWWD